MICRGMYSYLHHKIATFETTDYQSLTPWGKKHHGSCHVRFYHSQLSLLVPLVFGNQSILACYRWIFVTLTSVGGAYFFFEFFIVAFFFFFFFFLLITVIPQEIM